jgi:hypothetical protein
MVCPSSLFVLGLKVGYQAVTVAFHVSWQIEDVPGNDEVTLQRKFGYGQCVSLLAGFRET